MWLKYPENKPTKPGYYYTRYYNTERKQIFYKAFWWGNDDWHWRIKPEVNHFVPASHNDYYVPCQMWAAENITEVPK